jgi:hypothetical protein
MNVTAALAACMALMGCGKKASEPAAGLSSGSAVQPDKNEKNTTVAPVLDAAVPPAAAAPAAPSLPAGIRALVAEQPLPAIGTDELLLLAPSGGAVTITRKDGSKLTIKDGVIAKTEEAYQLPDGMQFDQADRAEIASDDVPGGPSQTAQVVTRNESQGDFLHRDVWFVPTVGTRTQIARDASMISVDWSDPLKRWAIVMLDGTMLLVDVKTGQVTSVSENAGSPSFDKTGTLYYRTIDGGAWKWSGDRGDKIGKGKKGKPQRGDLNEGIERAEYPPPVTFSDDGTPHFK